MNDMLPLESAEVYRTRDKVEPDSKHPHGLVFFLIQL